MITPEPVPMTTVPSPTTRPERPTVTETQPTSATRDERGIETYPVGLLRDIKGRKWLWIPRTLRRHIGDRNWRALRNYFNGYLAEWHYRPEGVAHRRCGRGWTRRAARRRLGAHIVEMNLHWREVSR